ncbi:MAG: amidase [Chloroflexi bacterium]|nr:MAG: amidase [Chloroflexota bacterium]
MKTIKETSSLIKAGKLSPVEATRELLRRIDIYDIELNSFVTVCGDYALERAAECEKEIQSGNYIGPLHGIPIAVKDICETKGIRTSVGSKVLQDWVPTRDAEIVKKLKRSGAILLGKLNMTEFAMGLYHPELHRPKNPWGKDVWVGASSSGSGVAVSAGLCMGAIGTDTGGSIRYPSATCSLVGIKPTYELVSRDGVFPLSQRLDHVGPICRSVDDAEIFLNSLIDTDIPKVNTPLNNIRIGVDQEFIKNGVNPEVSDLVFQAINVFEELGAKLIEVKVPTLVGGDDTWVTVTLVDALKDHEEFFPRNRSLYGPFGDQLEGAADIDPAVFEQCITYGDNFRQDFNKLFDDVDVIMCPTMVTIPPALKARNSMRGGDDVMSDWTISDADWGEYSDRIGKFTAPFNFSGNPTISLPCGFSSTKLPVSLQIIGKQLHESTIIALGKQYQSATDWHTINPSGFGF